MLSRLVARVRSWFGLALTSIFYRWHVSARRRRRRVNFGYREIAAASRRQIQHFGRLPSGVVAAVGIVVVVVGFVVGGGGVVVAVVVVVVGVVVVIGGVVIVAFGGIVFVIGVVVVAVGGKGSRDCIVVWGGGQVDGTLCLNR